MLTIQAGRIFSILAFFIFLATLTARNRSVAQESSAIPRLGERLTDDQAAALAKLAIALTMVGVFIVSYAFGK